MSTRKVLLVDKDSNDRSAIAARLAEAGHRVSAVGDSLAAFEKVIRDHYDLVITELNLPHMSGIELLKRIRDANQSLPVIVISADAGVSEAVEAMRSGASDFFVKPLTTEMIAIIATHTPSRPFNGIRGKQDKKPTIITKNKEMHRLLEQSREIADSQASIFIQGESGTGKELFARHIHNHSNRRHKPFVAINCSALPETLLESELFGHEKGSFTGAVTSKKGKFELANHGTMLLDEISEMDIQLQSKLLRVLQEREIDRIGGMEPIPVDVRIIATTNRDIEKQIRDGRFREDLFYRLNVVPFYLPALRDRRDDIPLLAQHFVEKYNRLDGRNVKGLTEEVVELLMQKPWKGNVRELENVIERALLMCKRDLIQKDDLLTHDKSDAAKDVKLPFVPTVSLKEMEKKVIFSALDQTDGNRTRAADILGISVRTLRNKLNEYREKMEAQ
ncbi:MAG: sigma-54-dependent Fis family transcriptional regulator [Deltaproteobacteria bacterium]|nr:MAG: sigma-54-dependent Fis family transcriptional regulator [Deltaproteobacteria bacterium]